MNDLAIIGETIRSEVPPRTPCGRIPDSPLRNPKHELLVHAFVQGLTGRDAGLAAGYKDGPGLKGNIARLRLHNPQIAERIAEVAPRAAALAEIHDAWILADVKFFEKASLAPFLRRDHNGKIALEDGLPILDFSKTDEEYYRLVEEISHTKFGPKLKIRDPLNALDKLMRYRGLLRDKVALTDPSGEKPAAVRFIVEGAPVAVPA
jgi:Terminase small subunit